MTVTVPPTLLQKIEQKELKYFRGKVEVPGFRKGKRVCSVCLLLVYWMHQPS